MSLERQNLIDRGQVGFFTYIGGEYRRDVRFSEEAVQLLQNELQPASFFNEFDPNIRAGQPPDITIGIAGNTLIFNNAPLTLDAPSHRFVFSTLMIWRKVKPITLVELREAGLAGVPDDNTGEDFVSEFCALLNATAGVNFIERALRDNQNAYSVKLKVAFRQDWYYLINADLEDTANLASRSKPSLDDEPGSAIIDSENTEAFLIPERRFVSRSLLAFLSEAQNPANNWQDRALCPQSDPEAFSLKSMSEPQP